MTEQKKQRKLPYNPDKGGEYKALAVVLNRLNKIKVDTASRVITLKKKFYPGNRAWGAIDYLTRRHGYVWIRKTS